MNWQSSAGGIGSDEGYRSPGGTNRPSGIRDPPTPPSTSRSHLPASVRQRTPHVFATRTQLVHYLHRLGVSHVYASPYLASRSTSNHGYSVVDYGRIDPKYGSNDDYDTFVAALQEHGMGHLLDVVPNHMSAASGENVWWTDVLENGPASTYADYFDIDWRPVREDMENRILLPVLDNQFGVLLESGELKLVYQDGAFVVRYYDKRFPIDPKTYDLILTHDFDALKRGLSRLRRLSKRGGGRRHRLTPNRSTCLNSRVSITAIRHLPDRRAASEDDMDTRHRRPRLGR